MSVISCEKEELSLAEQLDYCASYGDGFYERYRIVTDSDITDPQQIIESGCLPRHNGILKGAYLNRLRDSNTIWHAILRWLPAEEDYNLSPDADSLPFDDLVPDTEYKLYIREFMGVGGMIYAKFAEFTGRRGQPLGLVFLLPPHGVFMTFRRNHIIRIEPTDRA